MGRSEAPRIYCQFRASRRAIWHGPCQRRTRSDDGCYHRTAVPRLGLADPVSGDHPAGGDNALSANRCARDTCFYASQTERHNRPRAGCPSIQEALEGDFTERAAAHRPAGSILYFYYLHHHLRDAGTRIRSRVDLEVRHDRNAHFEHDRRAVWVALRLLRPTEANRARLYPDDLFSISLFRRTGHEIRAAGSPCDYPRAAAAGPAIRSAGRVYFGKLSGIVAIQRI